MRGSEIKKTSSARLRRRPLLDRSRNSRELGELISIGPAMLRDFELLGIRSVAELARQNPQRMYEKMERATGQRQDPCVLDTFCAAVAQAKNPRLPVAKCQWWWWSRERKRRSAGGK
jgi:hypothetical protein